MQPGTLEDLDNKKIICSVLTVRVKLLAQATMDNIPHPQHKASINSHLNTGEPRIYRSPLNNSFLALKLPAAAGATILASSAADRLIPTEPGTAAYALKVMAVLATFAGLFFAGFRSSPPASRPN